jgi:hypothetical protein
MGNATPVTPELQFFFILFLNYSQSLPPNADKLYLHERFTNTLQVSDQQFVLNL